MRASVEDLLQHPVSFLDDSGPDGDIAISTRVRLARNLKGENFPAAATEESAAEICEMVRAAAMHSKELGKKKCLEFVPSEMDPCDKEILLERRLVSREFIAKGSGTGLLVCPHECCSVMINEEDALRLQTIRPGSQLQAVWEEASKLDDELGAHLDYACDDKLGFLTSCPTNVGTGMRASVMLHLPALVLSGEIAATIQGINKLQLAVRGIFGEGTENLGSLYQISNQSTLGESENCIIERLDKVIMQLISREKAAREELVRNDRYGILDYVGRAYGVLRHSYKLDTKETLQCLSGVRLGVDLGMFQALAIHQVNELFVETGSAHLQKRAGRVLAPAERDVFRAEICREKLQNRVN